MSEDKLMSLITTLNEGEALLFAPSGLRTKLSSVSRGENEEDIQVAVQKFSSSSVKMKIRRRVTYDGGRSILATSYRGQVEK